MIEDIENTGQKGKPEPAAAAGDASVEASLKEGSGSGFSLSREQHREVRDKSPPRAAVLHEVIRRSGDAELKRGFAALAWSSLAAGMTMGFSLLARGVLRRHLAGVGGAPLIDAFGYTFGFLAVILARQQLFTENTLTAVLPFMTRPGWRNFALLLRLWAVVLVSSKIQQQRISNDAQQQLRLINNAVVQHTRGLLQGIDRRMQVIDHWVQSHPQANPLEDRALAQLVSLLNEPATGLVNLSFASEAGKAIPVRPSLSWYVEMPAVTWPAPGGIHIGTPVRHGPDEPWRWPVSRRLSRPVGDIAGVVAWIDLATLGSQHEGMRDKAAGAIMLARSDAVNTYDTTRITAATNVPIAATTVER